MECWDICCELINRYSTKTGYSKLLCLTLNHCKGAVLSQKVHIYFCHNFYSFTQGFEHFSFYLYTQLKRVPLTIIKQNTYILDPFL